MGYKYGIWLVYSNDEFPTSHIGHVTISCYMEKEEANNLYYDLVKAYGKYHDIYIDCLHPVIFDNHMYENDTNELYAWGYEGHLLENGEITNLWSKFQSATHKYKCNFSLQIHTSISYSKKIDTLNMTKINENKIVKCSIELVDITSDNPSDWHIITI